MKAIDDTGKEITLRTGCMTTGMGILEITSITYDDLMLPDFKDWFEMCILPRLYKK